MNEINRIQKKVWDAFLRNDFVERYSHSNYAKKYYIYLLHKEKHWTFEKIGKHLGLKREGVYKHYKDFLKFLQKKENQKYLYIVDIKPINVVRDIKNYVVTRLESNFLKGTISDRLEILELELTIDKIVKILKNLKNEKNI